MSWVTCVVFLLIGVFIGCILMGTAGGAPFSSPDDDAREMLKWPEESKQRRQEKEERKRQKRLERMWKE